jgi:hypothetical protein
MAKNSLRTLLMCTAYVPFGVRILVDRPLGGQSPSLPARPTAAPSRCSGISRQVSRLRLGLANPTAGSPQLTEPPAGV